MSIPVSGNCWSPEIIFCIIFVRFEIANFIPHECYRISCFSLVFMDASPLLSLCRGSLSGEALIPISVYETLVSRGAIGSDTDRILSYHIHIRTQLSDTDTNMNIAGCEKMISVSVKIEY